MIPKIIHYCWFGRGEKPQLAKKCIDSWRKYCPDYQIVEWNEDNFDIDKCSYVKEAYEAKKYAFVTDYVRLYVMVMFGGIYMDTDVELVDNLDRFLNHNAFSGFESKNWIPTGIMASEKEFPLFMHLLEHYKDAHFLNKDGTYNMTTNTATITEMLSKRGFVANGKYQIIEGFALYPQDVFCPFENETGILKKTENTVAIHWFNKSWVDEKSRKRLRITRVFHRFFGVHCFDWLKRLMNKRG